MKKVLLFNLLLAFALISEGQSIQNGLIGYYLFTGNARDQTSLENDGEVKGAALTVDRFGNPDNAYYFDGDTSRIVLPDSMLWREPQFSISLWFKTDTLGGVLIGNQNAVYPAIPNNFNGILYVGLQTGTLRGKIWNGSNSPLGPSDLVNDDEWHHAVMVNYGYAQVMYLDTAMVDSVSGNINPLLMFYNQIGNGYNHNWSDAPASQIWNAFKGSIDDVRIYNRPLTKAEIVELHYLPSIVGMPGEDQAHAISIYPNPTHDKLYLKLDHLKWDATISLFDSYGKRILESQLVNDITAIDLKQRGLSSGIYYIQVTDGNTDHQDVMKIILR